MIDLDLLRGSGIGWLDGAGPESQVVLSTRIRLARNLAQTPFSHRASAEERKLVLERVLEAGQAGAPLKDAVVLYSERLATLERQILHERHLASKDLVGLGKRSIHESALLTNGEVGVMINEEDHLRMHVLRSGFDLEGAFAEIELLDSDLGHRLPFAFHPQFGYLTSCPTNVGTGLRASVLIHLPGLVLTKEISKVLQGLAQVGLTFRGLYGEGSEVVGNFFQLSNQTTLGKSEEELIDLLGKLVRQVVEYEMEARDVLERDAPLVISDKVWRAYGLLKYARNLGFEEAMNLLSGVRLGVGMGMIQEVDSYVLNKLLVYTQEGHVAWTNDVSTDEPELSRMRADYVRQKLSESSA